MLDHSVWTLTAGQFKVWVACLLLASFKEATWWDGEQQVTIQPGSFITSQDHLAEAANVSRKIVRLALTNLERIGSIRAKMRAKKWTLIEVVNWPTYQGCEDEKGQDEGQLRAYQGPTEGHILRREEGKKEKNRNPSAARVATPSDTAPLAAPGPSGDPNNGRDRRKALRELFETLGRDLSMWRSIASRTKYPPTDVAAVEAEMMQEGSQ